MAACAKAMSREPSDRYPTATALADELQAWLDGSKRRERALEVVAQAEATLPAADALRARAAALRAEAEAELAAIPGWAPPPWGPAPLARPSPYDYSETMDVQEGG